MHTYTIYIHVLNRTPESVDLILVLLKGKRQTTFDEKFNKIGAKIIEVDPLQQAYHSSGYYTDVMTKFRVFDLIEYDRFIYMDSDSIYLKNMDNLFLIPPTPLAVPKAYWLDNFLTTILMVVQPTTELRDKVL